LVKNKKNYSLHNKVAIVTGASSGLGFEIAKKFLKDGAIIALCARRVDRLKKKFKYSKNVFYKKVDVSKPKEIKKFVQQVNNKFGRIDILVNNAGVVIPETIQDINYQNILRTFATNTFAPFLFIKECIRSMKYNNYGRIINISSGASVNCFSSYSTYSASKAALNTIAKSLANEIAQYNIKVNTMSPGPIKTEMFPKNKLSTYLAIPTVEYLSTLKESGPSGKFFYFMKKIKIIPEFNKNFWKKK
jgi:NAD(P)-dependent dehydrogenase (short-subunit alcohol dehydrogenase family)